MIKEYFGNATPVFSVIGAATTGLIALKLALGIFRFINTHVVYPTLGLSANLRKAGSWAVVTGCTDGIGKAYAERLAAKGLNVVLISRTLSKLTDMAKEVESKFKVETRVVAVDFTRADIYDEIRVKLAGLDIGVLVNNVGMSYDYPELFTEVDSPNFVQNMINMNCLSVAMMSQIVLPGMAQKRSGYIINIGSSAGSQPTPLLSLYSATKAFVDYFSQSVNYEYASKGVSIQSVKPYFVVSKLSKFRKPSAFVPLPSTFVKNALNTVGTQSSTTGFWAHDIQDFYMKYIPTSMKTNFLYQARSKALKKKAAAEKGE